MLWAAAFVAMMVVPALLSLVTGNDNPLTSQLALAGQDAEASATLKRYLALPGTRTRTVAQWDYVPDSNTAFAQFHQRFTSGLRKAGMPDR